MAQYFYSRFRVQQDLERSRRYAQEAQLQIRRSRRVQQVIDYEQDVRRLATAERLRADRQYQQYQIRRQTQKQQMQAQLLRERIAREDRLRQQELVFQAERRSRIIREEQQDRYRMIQQVQDRKRNQFLAASRRVQQQIRQRVQDQGTRQSILLRQQQLQQQKLQSQLRAIDVEIGTIYDNRQARRKTELLELQVLDEKIFKIKQQMRGSKIRQTALEDSLSELSKVIVPGV